MDPVQNHSPGGNPQRLYRLVLAACALVAMGSYASVLLLPPHGEHAWRDADGLGVARSFLHEGWSLLYPRVVERGSLSGLTGMELPLMNWLGAVFMKVGGEHDALARLPVTLTIAPLAAGMVSLGRRLLGSERAAYLGSAFLVLHPMVMVFAHKLMPEVPMLMFLVWGLVLAHDGLSAPGLARSLGLGVTGGGCLALAAVLKPTGVAAAVPWVAWAAGALRRESGRARLRVAWSGALTCVLPLTATYLWFRHARHLDVVGGLPLFHLHQDFWEWTRLIRTWTFCSVVFGRCLHLILLWPLVLWMAWRWRLLWGVLRERPTLGAWFAAALLFVVSLGSHNFHHYYYALPLCLPAALIVGAFADRALQGASSPRAAAACFLAILTATSFARARSFTQGITFDPQRVESALPRLGPTGLTVATDAGTPVVSLVILRRVGWALAPAELTPRRIAELKGQGARLLVESSFGGWLPEATRRALPRPIYADDQLRSYALDGPVGGGAASGP